MDPLSIIASVIAVCQAVERIGGLLFCIQTLVNAPRELTALVHEISNIRAALLGLQSRIFVPQETLPSFGCINQILKTCLAHMEEIDSLVTKSSRTRDSLIPGKDERIFKGTKRIAWVRKRGKIERLKRELKVALSAMQLELLSLNLTSQTQMVSCMNRLDNSFQNIQNIRDTAMLSIEDSHQKNIGPSIKAQDPDTLFSSPEVSRTSEAQVKVRPLSGNLVPAAQTLDTATIKAQEGYSYSHNSIQLKIQIVGVLAGLLGWLSIEIIGKPAWLRLET